MFQFFKKIFKKSSPQKSGCCGGGCCHGSMVDLDISSADHVALSQISDGVVIGKIIEKRDHKDENMTKVKVCQVDLGTTKEQILCGGINTYEGQIVAVATIGTKLSENFKIGERDIRGEVSRGMICAKSELGLEQPEPDGTIWDLPANLGARLGQPLKKFAKK